MNKYLVFWVVSNGLTEIQTGYPYIGYEIEADSEEDALYERGKNSVKKIIAIKALSNTDTLDYYGRSYKDYFVTYCVKPGIPALEGDVVDRAIVYNNVENNKWVGTNIIKQANGIDSCWHSFTK